MSENQESLRSLYDSGERLQKEIEDSYDYNSSGYQEKLQTAIRTYQECRGLVGQISLFSTNESLEDVVSSEIRYMLVDYHLANLTSKQQSPDRASVLKLSKSRYMKFLNLCDAYDLLSNSDRSVFQPVDTGAPKAPSPPIDAATRRNEKIAKFKLEKELKAKIDALSQNPHLLDEDELRKLQIASISLAIMKSIQQLEMIELELDILSKAPKPDENPVPHQAQDDRSRDRGARDGYIDKLDNIPSTIKGGPLLSQDGKPLRPFTLLDSRERLKQGVFKSGHNLPTMTIDEYLEEERRRGGIIEGGGEKSGIKPEPDEDNYEKADKETMKVREWDEFKEANPRGSGNTINRG
ncbi:TAP42-like protein [Choiromyces venosus 120613-1]|uniref:TAP42-like protein n=1 Tax=Choiromyces venosus 120613-1 TaxID=1336337 RepID=A0A3N4J113_9PEZI|nr:TAP42-like protein [Choiromyces venosus 120613-1]